MLNYLKLNGTKGSMTQKTVQQLNWRAATKSYNPEKKLSDEQVELLTQVARLAPTSYGLQPIKLYVVSDESVKKEMRSAGYNQAQFTDASHVFVLTVRSSVTKNDVEEYIERISQQRGVEKKTLSGLKDTLINSISHKTSEELSAWNSKQAYILLGMMLLAAAEHKIDATPMEGFANDKFDEILGLDETGYTSVVVMAAGYRSENDKYSKQAKVRKTLSEFVEHI